MNQCREQTALLQYINEVSFAINDMNLYLDTHPEDKKALAFMEEHVKMRKRALKEYAMKYGPLTIDTTDDVQSCSWDWVMHPGHGNNQIGIKKKSRKESICYVEL